MFRPRCLFPNTIYDQDNFIDYFTLPSSFRNSLSREAQQNILDAAKRFSIESAERKGDDPPSFVYSVTLDSLHKEVPAICSSGISRSGLLNFAGPDHFEREIRQLLEVPDDVGTVENQQWDDVEMQGGETDDAQPIARCPTFPIFRAPPSSPVLKQKRKKRVGEWVPPDLSEEGLRFWQGMQSLKRKMFALTEEEQADATKRYKQIEDRT